MHQGPLVGAPTDQVGRWSEAQLHMDIIGKGLYAIIMDAHTWGLSQKKVYIILIAITKQSGNQVPLVQKTMYFSATKCNINVCIVHIDGANNVIANCLSQDRFKWLAPLANSAPDNIPAWSIQSFIEASGSWCCYFGVPPSTH